MNDETKTRLLYQSILGSAQVVSKVGACLPTFSKFRPRLSHKGMVTLYRNRPIHESGNRDKVSCQ